MVHAWRRPDVASRLAVGPERGWLYSSKRFATDSVEAWTNKRSIRFSGSLSKGENWFSTKTGNIELELRGEQDLAVEASSRLGKITCTPELIDAHYEHGQHVGRIGSGAGKLILETKTGNIVLRL